MREMRAIRPSGAARRLLAMSAAVLTAGIGLVAIGPAAHAGTGCGGSSQAITLVNGWHSENSAYDTGDPSVCLENDGMVYLSGSVAAPSGSSEEFGTLPVWDWPEHNLYFDVYTLNSTYGVLRIDTDGTMWTYGGSGDSTGYLSLAGVSYPDPAVGQTDMTLENGWTSADSLYATGDPAYSEDGNDIVHLSGSMDRPAGTPANYSSDWLSATLPLADVSADGCAGMAVYTFGGGISNIDVGPLSSTNAYAGIEGGNAEYTSLAGISYPVVPATSWQALSLLNGSASYCPMAPSVYAAANVVYLAGFMQFPASFTGEIAVLPAADRPAHNLYMIATTGGVYPTANDEYMTVLIEPSGAVWLVSPSGGTSTYVELSGLSFHLGS